MKPICLQIENLSNPFGIDVDHPRLTWNCDSGIKQTGFRVLILEGDSLLLDTGKIESSSMNFLLPISAESRKRYTVCLSLFDEEGSEGEPSSISLEYGLLNKEDWKGHWIAGNYKVDRKLRYPVDCFRKVIRLSSVKKARLYITAAGLYEARINGEKCGEFVLAPGSTDPRKRIQYQTIDVTPLLKEGENVIEVELADGWYRGSSGARGRVNTFGIQTKFLAQLKLEDEEGKALVIPTDSSWDWSNDGPIRFADLKDGERVDANLAPSYSCKAKEVNYSANLTASNNVPITENETFKPVELIVTPSGAKVLKFPQNLSGYLSFSLQAKKGQTIRLRLGELIDKTGEFTQKNIQVAHKGKLSTQQEINYVCKEGKNEYKSKFFYGGFQYALIETDVEFALEDFTQIAVYSRVETTSSFSSSNPLLDQFHHCTLWSLKSNSTDFPSDCPTRERMGWTGDSQIFFNTASYLTDYATFADKHLRDVYDRQWRSGRLPQIAPYAHEDWYMATMNGSVGWACVGVFTPLNHYYKYGDKRILERYFEGMLRYAKFMMGRQGKPGGVYAKPMFLPLSVSRFAVNCGQSYGEWAEPVDVMAFAWYDFASPHPEESTAYTYYTLSKVVEVAKILGKENDPLVQKIAYRSEGARRAYQTMIRKKRFSLDTDRQAKLVRPLYMGLLDEKDAKFAKKRLIEALEHYNWRLGTGFLSTPWILDVLTSIDVEYAYRLLENEEMPGWLSMPKAGAQTVWESWEGPYGDAGIASLNHYSKGAVFDWVYRVGLGIQIAGENHFRLAPRPGGHFTHMEGSYRSIYGTVSSSWRKEGDSITYSFELPANTTASLSLPNGEERLLLPGKTEITIPEK